MYCTAFCKSADRAAFLGILLKALEIWGALPSLLPPFPLSLGQQKNFPSVSPVFLMINRRKGGGGGSRDESRGKRVRKKTEGIIRDISVCVCFPPPLNIPPWGERRKGGRGIFQTWCLADILDDRREKRMHGGGGAKRKCWIWCCYTSITRKKNQWKCREFAGGSLMLSNFTYSGADRS